jgi:hypothetical protein
VWGVNAIYQSTGGSWLGRLTRDHGCTAALALSPLNNMVLFTSYDPTDTLNMSAVFETARRRVWPVFVIEQVYHGNNTVVGRGIWRVLKR